MFRVVQVRWNDEYGAFNKGAVLAETELFEDALAFSHQALCPNEIEEIYAEHTPEILAHFYEDCVCYWERTLRVSRNRSRGPCIRALWETPIYDPYVPRGLKLNPDERESFIKERYKELYKEDWEEHYRSRLCKRSSDPTYLVRLYAVFNYAKEVTGLDMEWDVLLQKLELDGEASIGQMDDIDQTIQLLMDDPAGTLKKMKEE